MSKYRGRCAVQHTGGANIARLTIGGATRGMLKMAVIASREVDLVSVLWMAKSLKQTVKGGKDIYASRDLPECPFGKAERRPAVVLEQVSVQEGAAD